MLYRYIFGDRCSGAAAVPAVRSTWGIVILNWNGTDETLTCIRSIDAAKAQCADKEFISIVVDNGSDEHALSSLAEAMASYPDWRLVPLGQNLGFSKGMNAGVAALEPHNPDYVLLVNNDIELDKSALTILAEDLEQEAADVLGLAVVGKTDPSRRRVAGYRYFSWFGAALPIYHSESMTNGTQQVDYICGSAMLCNAGFLRRIGGVPEASFMYYEELRLMQALPSGKKPRCCTGAIAVHAIGTSAEKLRRPSRHYYAAHACYQFTVENGVFRLPSVVAARLLRLSYLSVKLRHTLPLRDGLLALLDFLRGMRRQPPQHSATT